MSQIGLIGIDLGTTYCVVATFIDGTLTIMNNEEGQPTTPSVVFFPDEACTLEKAIAGSQAETSFMGHPDRGVRFVKRLMGRKDVQNPGEDPKQVVVHVKDKAYSPEQISSVILRKLIRDAEELLFEGMAKVTDAVITVPAYFGPEERAATEEAAKLAGLKVRALIPEPIAAAIDYAKNQATQLAGKTVFVYDLGGGTFDATIMRIEQAAADGPLSFWVLGKDGSIELGGSNWDEALADHVAADYASQHDGDNPKDDIATWDRLVVDCERMKRSVSQKSVDEVVDIPCTFKGVPHTTPVTREQFDDLTRMLVDESLNKSSQLMERVFRADCLANQIAEKLQSETGGPRLQDDIEMWNRLLTDCVAAYEALKQQEMEGNPQPSTTLRFMYQGQPQTRTVTPDDFAAAAAADANPWSLIDEVLLVGGSTKMKIVPERLESLTGKKPRKHQGVDFNVARGAAIIAFTPDAWTDRTGLDAPVAPPQGADEAAAQGKTGPITTKIEAIAAQGGGKLAKFVFMDVVNDGIGIETLDPITRQDRNSILIKAGTTTEQDVTESFCLAEDGQTGADIVIYKGNSESLQDPDLRKLGMVSITGLPATTKAGEEIVITLQVDRSGLVKGTATHAKSKKTVDIQVKYNFEN